jgi:UDP-glucose 4-epimerase
MKDNIVYITGAYGFIGRNVAKHFSARGWYVIGIGYGEWEEEEFSEWGIAEWYSSAVSVQSLSIIEQKPDLIVHCAGSGSVGFSLNNPMEDFQMTVDSTLAVLEFMRLYCPNTRLIFPSSASVYGEKDDVPIKEDEIRNPVSPYGFHKMIAEELCFSYAKNFGTIVSIVRLFSVYGLGLQKQILWDACNKINQAEKEVVFFGSGNETRDLIHINDVAQLFFILAKSQNVFEILNGAAGQQVQIIEILNILLEAYGKQLKIVFNNILKEGDPKFYWADVSIAKALGWNSRTSLDEGIREYVANFKGKNG